MVHATDQESLTIRGQVERDSKLVFCRFCFFSVDFLFENGPFGLVYMRWSAFYVRFPSSFGVLCVISPTKWSFLKKGNEDFINYMLYRPIQNVAHSRSQEGHIMAF